MPVEIRELIIRATVSKKSGKDLDDEKETDSEDRDQLVSACVEQVLKILERSKER
jgi:hypothetical protein